MKKTLLTLRIVFFLLCIVASYLVCYVNAPDWDKYRKLAVFIGASIGALVILVDLLLKGFSLRGLSALTFGLFVGWLMAYFISNSPLFQHAESPTLYLARLALFVILMYLGSVIALRGRDEFNLVIPYVRFVPHGVEVPLAVVDTSALIDGRIVAICESKFLAYALVIPRFVLDQLHQVADSPDPGRQMKGRKGLEVLNQLGRLEHVDLRIHESEIGRGQKVDDKLIYLAQSINAKLLTTDYNLAQMAQFQHVDWLNINSLYKALNPDVDIGEMFEVDLVKRGREPDQAVGYLTDGSMVVVNDGKGDIGKTVVVEVQSILPSAGGKMVFAKIVPRPGRPGEEGDASPRTDDRAGT